MVAAAIIGGAVVGAAGSAIGGHQAGAATDRASRRATDAQLAALDQQKELSAPYRGLGEKAISTYEDLLGLGKKGSAGISETLSNLPGYQFTRDQGIEATARQAGASGMNLSGNQLAAIEGYGANLADQTYGEQLNRLLAPINIGQAAAAGQAANVGSAATNIGNIATAQGNNQANIALGTVGGITGAIGGGVNNYLTYQTIKGLNSPGSVGTYNPGGDYIPPVVPSAGTAEIYGG